MAKKTINNKPLHKKIMGYAEEAKNGALNRREFATMLHKNPEIAKKILADANSRSEQKSSIN